MTRPRTTFQWTLIWEQPHSEAEEDQVRSQIQDAFDSGQLAVHPKCRAMEARVFGGSDGQTFHAFIECTCPLSDPEKFAAQTLDGEYATD